MNLYQAGKRYNDILSENRFFMETVLLVDDEDVVLNVGALMLQKLNYKVLKARTGQEARPVYEDNKDTVSLVILDLELPDEMGTDTCQKLREINPDVEVLHSSGLVIGRDNEILDCGCKHWLSKPFNMSELAMKVKEMLEELEQVAS